MRCLETTSCPCPPPNWGSRRTGLREHAWDADDRLLLLCRALNFARIEISGARSMFSVVGGEGLYLYARFFFVLKILYFLDRIQPDHLRAAHHSGSTGSSASASSVRYCKLDICTPKGQIPGTWYSSIGPRPRNSLIRIRAPGSFFVGDVNKSK